MKTLEKILALFKTKPIFVIGFPHHVKDEDFDKLTELFKEYLSKDYYVITYITFEHTFEFKIIK
jgi:hypothetical protein